MAERGLLAVDAQIQITAPIEKTYRWVVYGPLTRQFAGTRKIPGVACEFMAVTLWKLKNDLEIKEKS